MLLILLGLAMIWAAQIQTLAFVDVCSGRGDCGGNQRADYVFVRQHPALGNQTTLIGDYIEINGLRGRVVDINMLNTLMMQIGPNPLIGQPFRQNASLPNSLLLSHTVRRDNIFGQLCDSYGGNPRADSFGFGRNHRPSESRS